MKVTLDDIRERESRHVLQTYKRQPVAFVRGRGVHLYDVDGREYLDFVTGIGKQRRIHAAHCTTSYDRNLHVRPP